MGQYKEAMNATALNRLSSATQNIQINTRNIVHTKATTIITTMAIITTYITIQITLIIIGIRLR